MITKKMLTHLKRTQNRKLPKLVLFYKVQVKVKLSLCFNWATRHEGVLGWRYSSTHWRWVVTFKPRPLYPQGKNPWFPLNRRLSGPQSRSVGGGEEKNSQPPPEIESHNPYRPACSPALYDSVSKSSRTGRLERELHMVQLSATRWSCIAILYVSLKSFAAITFRVASQREFTVVSVYFVIDSLRKLLDIPSYYWAITALTSL
jgi:hypothetical protein